MISFLLNDNEVSTAMPAGMTLLDFIRYNQQLTGTKIGCREGDCGACTVLTGQIKNNVLEYKSATSCLMALGNAAGKHIVTIEGINLTGQLNFIQEAFSREGATQCGFCTPGFIVSLAGHCTREKETSYEHAIDSVNGNICRCTGYKSIERAARSVNDKLCEREGQTALNFAVEQKILPGYFLTVEARLKKLNEGLKAPVEGPKNKILAGGTDLYVQQQEAMLHESIDFYLDKPDLRSIVHHGNTCQLGASVTVTDMAESPVFQKYFPGLDAIVKLISSTQIRNMATVAGNFVNASPIGDLTIFFLALDAQLVLSDGRNQRQVALRKFYKGYKALDKKSDEWVESIQFTLPDTEHKFNFEKVCKRSWLDIASVNTAIHLRMKDDRIEAAGLSAGGVAPIPTYLSNTSDWLTGKRPADIHFDELLQIVQSEISPISDVRGTAQYKRLLLSQLIRAHFIILFPHLENVMKVIS
ncbi:MAG: 2Fe-2S iron-sulfur cluster binding domain-containing protein [Chitinophagaceae bacterium]|nr:MAG: 2Fe-2S iron-sulfur cluster binding domain-containing protein [Chitinophagaceae bacterium]